MPKRKRPTDDDERDAYTDSFANLSPLALRLYSHIQQSVHSLHAGLKLARGFERQKLGRRIKGATEGSTEDHTEGKAKNEGNEETKPRRLDGEVAVLKEIDLAKLAETHLFKVLGRIKRVRENEAFQECERLRKEQDKGKEQGQAWVGQVGREEMNVKGRLFKSMPVVKSLGESVHTTYAILGLEEGVQKAAELKMRTAYANLEAGGVSKGKTKPGLPNNSHENSNTYDENKMEGDSEHDKHLVNDAFGRLASPLISSESPSRSPNTSSPSLSPSASPNLNHDKQTRLISNFTTFLPTLSHHGYISASQSSDASISDPDDNLLNEFPAQRRRNRLGQKQRQMIAERKYGRNANHLKQDRSQGGRGRDEDWDRRTGAVAANGERRFGREAERGRARGRGRIFIRGGSDSNAGGHRDLGTSRRIQSKPDSDNKPLHPSWIAAQKRKEDNANKGVKMSLAAFRGKKITFD